jgi:serine/threonine protein kinase
VIALTNPLRRRLLRNLIRLHQIGIQHNDMEPRNVTTSPGSGPVIIDFDNARLDHACKGDSCEELCQVAKDLELDLGKLTI